MISRPRRSLVFQSLVFCVVFGDHCLSFCPFSSGHCIVCPSIYGFWLPLWYFFFNTIVLSVPPFMATDYLFGTFSFIPWYCLSLDLRFRSPLWYFFFNTIVFSVPWFTASDYLFGTFSLIPLYYLSLDIRLLITSLVLFFNTIVLSVPRFTASDYLFGTFCLIPLYCLYLDLRLLITSLVLFLSYRGIVCPSIYGFRSPLWYCSFNTIVLSVPRFTASNYLFGTFSFIPLYCLFLDLRFQITSLVLFL